MSLKLSVIIPVYNVAPYLEACLDSVLGQTLPPSEYEIICVDDGSTDSSPEILARYDANFANLRVVRQPNGGLSVARNRGLDAAQGEYVFFLDSDDFVLGGDAFRTLYEFASEQDLDEFFFTSKVFMEDPAEAIGQFQAEEDRYVAPPEGILDGRALYCYLESNQMYQCSACKQWFRRAFLEANGIRFYEGIYHEDQVFTLECLSMAKRATCLDLPCYGRRVRSDSIMTGGNRIRSAMGYCAGHHALAAFAKERLQGADAEFMRHYRRKLVDQIDQAVEHYRRSDDQSGKRSFWQNLPADVYLPFRWGQLRARVKRFQRSVQRRIRRLMT